MSNPETVLTNKIRTEILRAYPYAWILKTAGGPYQTAGVPDLLVCLDGILFGLEVKCQRPGESEDHARARATPRQLDQLAQIERAGGRAGVVLSAADALRILDSASAPENF